MCDVTHQNPFGLVLIAVNKVRSCIVYIFHYIYFCLPIFIQYTVFHVNFWFTPDV